MVYKCQWFSVRVHPGRGGRGRAVTEVRSRPSYEGNKVCGEDETGVAAPREGEEVTGLDGDEEEAGLDKWRRAAFDIHAKCGWRDVVMTLKL
jgi:hypothetical protein